MSSSVKKPVTLSLTEIKPVNGFRPLRLVKNMVPAGPLYYLYYVLDSTETEGMLRLDRSAEKADEFVSRDHFDSNDLEAALNRTLKLISSIVSAAESPVVAGIYTSPKAGAPMEPQETAEAVASQGLRGDRYFFGEGMWSKHVPPGMRDITLIELDAIRAANAELTVGNRVSAAQTRRNIITDGIKLNPLVGAEFRVGPVVILGLEPCTPCERPGKCAGTLGFKKAFENRGGLRGRIITGGIIKLGDPITK